MAAAQIEGLEPAAPDDPDALSLRAAEFVANLVAPAKSDALAECGEGRRALDIAATWVQSKVVPLSTGSAETTDLPTVEPR